ncbi:E3 ubiquitin-protein ligase RBBP6-like [Gouania willdenowi]|uniref:E3 ubiquitin-protein ligase RBBP6-like n=1 Tax=Gouania willdenowi TaxID=441366 RepID=UPI00105446DD|nr:E3 ubiquitin-protein ligase RBBP6-like [Gouania willdenowi]
MSLAQLTKTQDKEPKPVKTSKGVPQSFMVKAEPGTKGAMLTVTGESVIPAIDAEAYAKGKKERPPFVPHEQSSSEEEIDPIPYNLLCPICAKLMIDAVLIPCCGNSYCDECIRTALLDSEDHVCFTCKQSDVSPDNLIANKFLRQVVNNYKNGTTYAVHRIAQVLHHPALPPPPPQLSRLHSRQLDPLKPPLVMSSTTPPSAFQFKGGFVQTETSPDGKATSRLDEVTKGFHKDDRSYPLFPIFQTQWAQLWTLTDNISFKGLMPTGALGSCSPPSPIGGPIDLDHVLAHLLATGLTALVDESHLPENCHRMN